MMNTLESFLAPARVSDWMACAHVRRCPNWQCWWDEDSVVAASGLTEDDERNLQADKMRSKARARKLAKSRCSFFLLRTAFSRRLQTPASLHVQCVLVICHILKRGGGDSLSRVNSSAKNVSRSGYLVSFPCMHRSWLRWFPASESFMCDVKRRCCFGWSRSCRDKHCRPKILARICSFRMSDDQRRRTLVYRKLPRKVVEMDSNFFL